MTQRSQNNGCRNNGCQNSGCRNSSMYPKKSHTCCFPNTITISSKTTLATILGIVKLSRSGFMLRRSCATDANGSITDKTTALNCSSNLPINVQTKQTRKLSYCREDRAMRPMYMGALKIFRSPWQRPQLLLTKFLMGFCSDWAYKCAHKIWNP